MEEEEEGWVVQLYGARLVAAVFPPAPARGNFFWRAGVLELNKCLRIEAEKMSADSTLTLCFFFNFIDR